MTSPSKEQEEQEISIYLNSFSERRRIREELERSQANGFSVDPADKCKCPECGIVHFKPRKET